MMIMLRKLAFFIILCFCCTGAGYKGTLPDIKGSFEHLRATPQKVSPLYDTTDDENYKGKLKKTPKENKTYIDIILKKDKTSPYITDLNEVILILEKMNNCIKSKGSVQKFNAIASSIIDHADFMARKYENSPEKYYISFAKLQNIASQSRDIATLLCESQVYIKYLTYQGEGQVYTKDNINAQLKDYQLELESTIQIMRNSR